jgi:hypothetical protein
MWGKRYVTAITSPLFFPEERTAIPVMAAAYTSTLL